MPFESTVITYAIKYVRGDKDGRTTGPQMYGKPDPDLELTETRARRFAEKDRTLKQVWIEKITTVSTQQHLKYILTE